MEHDQRLPSGEWKGFYLEAHQPRRGWMHLYLAFVNGKITGEGTDYVGPWTASGDYDLDSGQCQWTKQYVGKHVVHYDGLCGKNGIQGQWRLSYLNGDFHVWPISHGHLDELYLRDDLTLPHPSVLAGPAVVDSAV